MRRFEWFEFGLVRGLIGLIIAGITMLLLSLSLPPMISPVESATFTTMGNVTSLYETASSLILVAVLVGLVVSVIVSGLAYEFGAYVCRRVGLRTVGVWSAVTVGLIGGFLLALAVISAVSLFLLATSPSDAGRVFLAGVGMLPASAITEIGYAVVTYGVYRYAGWELPSL